MPASLNDILDKFFGTHSTTNTWFAGNDQGIDVNLSAGTPVRTVAPSVYEGGDTYRSVFKDTVSGNWEYYMHLVTDPFTVGQQVPTGTQVGVVSGWNPQGWGTPPGATTQYESYGPHLEFGVLAQPGLGFTGQNPLPSLQADYAAASTNKQQSYPWWDPRSWFQTITNTAGQAGNAIGSDVQRSVQDFTNPGQAAHDLFGTSTNPLGDAVTGIVNQLDLKKWGLLALLAVAIVLLVLELFRSGTTVTVLQKKSISGATEAST
jgi:hypothetical protein